jgi:23S rRNA pseudouridine2605 synthase
MKPRRGQGGKKFGSKSSFGNKKFRSEKRNDENSDRKKSFDKEKKRFDSGSERKSYGKKRLGEDDRKFERKKKFSRDDSKFDRKKKFGEGDSRFDRKKKYSDDDPGFERKKKFGHDDESKFERKKKIAEHKSGKSFDKPWKKREGNFNSDRKKKFGSGKDGSFEQRHKFGGKKDFDNKKTGKYVLDKEYRDDEEFPLEDYYQGKKDLNKARKEHKKSFKSTQSNDGRNDGLIRLNKYIANTGLCSRREADEMIKAGVIKVNGQVVTELGTRIHPDDKVQYGDDKLKREKMVYILVNKPKDHITTMDDPEGRKTVMGLIRGACKERVYPVGRLDRNTTGILLFTNDGDLTRKLTHPRFLVSKVYHVFLDKNLTGEHLREIRSGIMLEDGFIKPDDIQYAGEAEDKRQVGIEIHSGRNRIVRRIFEHLGYTVVKLDRVSYAGLTKKDTPRGKWRMLTEKEVGYLKMLGAGNKHA